MRMMKGCICALPLDVEYLLRSQMIQIVVYEAVGDRIHVEDVLLRHAPPQLSQSSESLKGGERGCRSL